MSGTGGTIAGRGGSAGKAGTENTSGTGGSGEGGQAGETGQGGTAGSGGTSGIGGTAGGGAAGSGGGGMAGTGETSGAGGTAGAAAGMGGTAGTSVAGSGGSAGSGNTASGCANLTVPLTQVGDRAHFVITLTNPANMTTGTLAIRVYVQAGSGGLINGYVQDTSNHFLPPASKSSISTLVGTWTNLQWNVGNEAPGSTGIDKTNIKRIGIEVAGTGSTAWTNPTKVYVDSMTVTAATTIPAFTFDTSGTVDTSPSNGMDVGGQVLWLNSYSGDTSASNVTLGWLASCP